MASTAASSTTATAASAADTVYYTVNTKDVEAPKTPFLHEIWNYEGDLTILPRKFSSCVQAAFGDHGAHFTSEYFTKTFVEAKQFDPAGVFFITSRSDCAGVALAWTDSSDSKIGRLHWLAVHPKHRRKGVGRALVRLVAQYHNKKGRATMYLKTEAARDAAIKLYESEGFVLSPTKPADA